MRRWSAALGAALAVTLLAGCGGAPRPKAQPTPSPSTATPTASPSPTASPPTIPAAVKKKDRAGAEAAVRYFIDSLNYSGQSGDTAPFRASFSPLCTRCEALADAVDKTYADGGYYRGGNWKALQLKFYDIDAGVAYIDTNVAYDAQTWQKSASAKPIKYAASANHLHSFQLKQSRGKWRVGALDPES